VPITPPGVLRSREKVVWEWPNTADRIIEDLS
jgi:hypothetical protein